MITSDRLNELMRERYSYIIYESFLAEEYLSDSNSWYRNDYTEDQIADNFADYLVSQDLADEVVE